MQIHPNIKSEYGRLRSVMVGIADKMGPKPAIEDCYDARSRESVELGTYPEMEDCMVQLNSLVEKLESLGVEVLRPDVLDATNQVFTRDIGFVIDDQFILPNIIEDRASEANAMDTLLDRIPSVSYTHLTLPTTPYV